MNVVLPLLRPGRDFRGVWSGIQIHDRAKAKGRLLFVNKKKQKNFVNAGQWALSRTRPLPSINKSFCAAFFKKRPLP
jgi:hypothetical protein